MEELTQLLHHVTRRYRSRLLARLVLHALFGVALIGLLAWRLQGRQISPGWSVGVPIALALLGAGALVWELRQRWMSARATVDRLDQQLGLQQRLVTAAEFAQTSAQHALYPILLDDVAKRYETQHLRLPRPWDRTSAALAVAVLLLLLWPGARPLMRLAQLPQPVIPPPQPPTPTPPEPPPQSQEQQDQSSDAAQSSATSPSGGQGQSQEQQRGGSGSQDAQQGQGRQDQSQQGQGAQSQGASGAPQEGSQGSQQADARQPSSEQQQQAQQGASGSQQRDTDSARQSAQRGQSSTQTGQKSGRSAQQASGQQGGADQGRAESQQGGGEGQQQASAQRTAGQSQQGSGAGGSMSSGNQEMLKAQIQELLKEVSGELKELQEQLASAQGLEQPQAGTSTDPDLYGGSPDAEQLPSAQRKLPMQLQTDTGETKQQRPGGGSGQPSGEVGHAAPQTEAEDVQLSDVPLDERPTERQPIPPEYRSVFDQLRSRTDIPSEADAP